MHPLHVNSLTYIFKYTCKPKQRRLREERKRESRKELKIRRRPGGESRRKQKRIGIKEARNRKWENNQKGKETRRKQNRIEST